MGAGDTKIGAGCSFGNFTFIANHGCLEIGDNFLASSHLVINTGTHDLETHKSRPTRIQIGSDVWLGARVTIIEDTFIGSDSIIGAGSLVMGSFGSNSLIVGVPGRVIRQLKPDGEKHRWHDRR
jgi:acetyltransferase-like isoleucine patch superfamily enzyme